MTQSRRGWYWKLGLAGALAVGGALAELSVGIIATSGDRAFAQLNLTPDTAPDRNLGTAVVPVTPQVDLITGGTRPQNGPNLFHSFAEFNVLAARGVYFENPAGITNILSRVTGNDPSDVLGTLGVLGNANLFLMNPNGIVFGPNASLDVGGSFVATTANAIQLGNAGLFSASEPATSNLLTVNPSALFFNALANQAEIVNRSTATSTVLGSSLNGLPNRPINGLQVLDGQSLSLVGGDVSLEGGVLSAPGGRVELGGVAEPGTVGLNGSGNNLGLSFAGDVARADVSLTNGAFVDVTAGGGGSIAITAQNLDILGGSGLFAGIGAGLGEAGSQAGDIEINAIERVRFEGEVNFPSRISNLVGVGALGNAGDLIINTGFLEGTGSFAIGSSTFGQGNAGRVTITASDEVSLSGGGAGSGVGSLVGPSAIGNGADIIIETRSLDLSNSAQLATSAVGQGNAGNIQVNASESVSVRGGSVLQAVSFFGQGNAGSVTIEGRDGVVPVVSFDGIGANGLVSTASTAIGSSPDFVSTGKGGDLNITARSLSLTNGAQLFTSTLGQNPGQDAGNIRVNALDSISVSGGSLLRTDTAGQGNAGSVTIDAPNAIVSFDGVAVINDLSIASGIVSAVQPAPGIVGDRQGGDINITARSLSLTNGAQLNTGTFGIGDAGGVTIQASDTVSFDGVGSNGFFSAALSTVETGAMGSAGNIDITTGSLSVTNGANLQSLTRGQGNAGSVIIQASDISLDGVGSNNFSSGAFSTVEATGMGKGGGIDITTGSLSLTNGAVLNSSTFGQGNAGSILVQADDSVSLTNSSQIRSAVEAGAVGMGGDIEIGTGLLSLTNGAQLGAGTFGRGNAGGVTIQASDISFDGVGSNGLPSGAFSTVDAVAVGKGGGINVTAESLSLTNGAQLAASTFGRGNAGSVTIQASDISFDGVSSNGFASGAFSTVAATGRGKGGDIDITTGSLSLTNGAALAASTFGTGDAGGVIIQASDITFDGVGSNNFPSGAFSTVEAGAVGKGGGIDITTGSLSLTDGAVLNSSTFGRGNAGRVMINASDAVSFDGIGTNGVSSGIVSAVQAALGLMGDRRGGDINITASSLSLTNGAQLRSDTFGVGNAGNVFINTQGGTVSLDGLALDDGIPILDVNGQPIVSGISSSVGSGAMGNSGIISIKAGSLSLSDSAGLFSSTSGTGDAGDILVQVNNTVSLTNESQIRGGVEAGGEGKGADINIQARSLSVTDGSQVGAFVSRTVTLPDGRVIPGGQGEGGNIVVNAPNSITLSGIGSTGFSSGLLALTERGASGPAGDITVSTGNFQVADGAVVAASTFNPGDGGNITINANTFEAAGGGQVLTNTRNSGTAGTIKLNVTDNIALSGSDPNFADRLALAEQNLQFGNQVNDVVVNEGSASGLFANTDPSSAGGGGNVFVSTTNLNLTNGAQVSAQSQGTGIAGNIRINAHQALNADNGEIIAASTEAGGGNITITSSNINLRNSSPITTSVAGGRGGGGNITINSDTFIAFDDSDILANAEFGDGGNITINSPRFLAEGFGSATAVGRNPGDFAQFRGNGRVDVSASSRFGTSGTIAAADSSFLENSLTPLSANFVSPEQVVAGSCLARRNVEQGSFTVTGTGGLPRSPYEAISGQFSVTGVQPIQGSNSVARGAEVVEHAPWKRGDPIQEAQGIVVTADGRTLVGTTPQLVALAKAQSLVCDSD